MKNIILSVAFIMGSFYASSQFKCKKVNSDFDGSYRIAYNEDYNGNLLKLENVGGKVCMYVVGSYFCDENPSVDLLFVVNGEKFVFTTDGVKSNDGTTMFLIDDIEDSVILNHFLNGTKIKIRVNESHCEDDYFEFSLSNSTNAFNFMK